MKKQDLFKFSLTAICVAVLSACGSSGGGSLAVENTPTTPSTNANSNTGANNSAELAAAQKAAQEAAAQKAAAEKAAAEAAAKQAAAEKAAAAAKTAAEKAAAEKAAAEAKAAADKAAAEKAAKEAAAKAAADQAAAVKKAAEEAAKKALEEKAAADKQAAEKQAKAAEEAAKKAAEEAAKKAANDATNPFGAKDKLTAEPDTARNVSFVGFKQTVKVDSNLATNTSEKKDSTSDIPTPMAVQNPHASLDTIVVAEPKDDAGAARVYLEDFDTRFINKTDVKVATVNAAQLAPMTENRLNGNPTDDLRGNRVLHNIYRTKTGVTAEVSGNPAIEKQRSDLKAAVEKAKNAIKAEMQKAVNIQSDAYDAAIVTAAGATVPAAGQDEISKLEAQVKVAFNQTYPGATAEQTAAYRKIAADAILAQISAKKAEVSAIKQKVDTAQVELAKSQFDLNKFELANGSAPAAVKSKDRLAETGLGYATKTKTIGEDVGKIWIFAHEDVFNKHQNFTEKDESDTNDKNEVKKGFVYKGKDHNGNLLVNLYDISDANYAAGAKLKDKDKVQARNLTGTVAEVYGYRSKAMPTFEQPSDILDYTGENNQGVTGRAASAGNEQNLIAANNLPLVNEYNGAKLSNVQYGRVTTALDSKAATDEYLKKGLDMGGDTPTYIASFGEYGKAGTENHYFYRGINNVGAEELKVLKADAKNGTITYDGHAVAYGLNNNYRGGIPIPTALGAQAGFVSGNHAELKVNLGSNQVEGRIFNKWYDSVNSPKELRDVDLVKLNGVIADNGNIAGTAIRQDNQATGVFGATLFGGGQEVGGTFASDKHTKAEQWGGVFAGIRQPEAAKPADKPNMAVGVDKKN